MNLTIRRVGIAMLVLFIGLVGQLSYLQLLRADDLEHDPGNVRVFLRDINRPRGSIVSADGVVLAESRPTQGEDIEQQRIYNPETAGLFAHIVGYQAVNLGNTGVEAQYNDELVGRDVDQLFNLDNLADVFSGKDLRGNVVLTTSVRGQALAAAGLAGRRGSVVVLDTRSGAIVAAFSNPTYDPNLLATHDGAAASAAFQDLQPDSPDSALLQRSWRQRYPPGSTFKVVTTSVALERGVTTLDRVFPTISELDLPQTDRTLSNFGGQSCGGTLVESFRKSCNTTFAQLGLDLGDQFAEGIESFGVSADPPSTDLRPNVARSIGPEPGEFKDNQPLFAQSAIGQGTIAVTPLAMAMVAQGVANGGVIMVPHVLDHVENSSGEDIRGSRFEPRVFERAMQPETATTLRDLMVDVVNNGTGTAGQIPGVQVAGKTGTAQVAGNPNPHAWFVAFAPAEAPVYAIAVLVENGGDLGSEATGGRVAAPIAAAVLRGLLEPAG